MRLAHAEARANGASDGYGTVSSHVDRMTRSAHRFAFRRDAELNAMPATHAAILAERTAALMIDSGRRMAAELAAIDARALALGVRL